MPAKKPKKKTPAKITPSQFRLGPEALSDIDRIAAARESETGVPHSRTDVIRWLVKLGASRVGKEIPKNPPASA